MTYEVDGRSTAKAPPTAQCLETAAIRSPAPDVGLEITGIWLRFAKHRGDLGLQRRKGIFPVTFPYQVM